MCSRFEVGARAEDLIARRLASDGFEIVGRNVRAGHLELDIVARRRTLIVVCEVRARSTDAFGHPAETVTATKMRRVREGASRWLRSNRIAHRDVRFDVAAVLFDRDPPHVDYYEHAF